MATVANCPRNGGPDHEDQDWHRDKVRGGFGHEDLMAAAALCPCNGLASCRRMVTEVHLFQLFSLSLSPRGGSRERRAATHFRSLVVTQPELG